jgi:hypothetical protein
MDGLEAVEKLSKLNKRIEALDFAYRELWSDFDKRLYALALNELQADLEQERDAISDKLQSVRL